MGEYFAFFNNWIFEQLQYYAISRTRKSLQNFGEFATEEVKHVTKSHLIWAELTSHLHDYVRGVEDYKKRIDLEKVKAVTLVGKKKDEKTGELAEVENKTENDIN